jgi:YHS domain-containing protein
MTKRTRAIAIVAAAAVILVLAVAAQQKSEDKAVDPVCGMTVVKAKAAATYEYKGTTYYFCSTGCKDTFAKEPEKYLAKAGEKAEAARAPMAGGPMMAGRMHGTPAMMPHGAHMGMMAGRMGGVNALLMRHDVTWTYERTADGVTVKIGSKDPETVKAIQERLARMKEMKETMAAPPAAASAASECSNPNCPMKEKTKK